MEVKFTFDCSLSDFLRRPRAKEVFDLIINTAIDAVRETFDLDDRKLQPRKR